MYYVAMDIGCIECGEESDLLGIFKDESRANEVLALAREKQLEDWHGQHSFIIFQQRGLSH